MAHQNKPVSIVIQDTNGKSLPGKLFRQIRVGFWRIFYPELYSITLAFCGDYTGLIVPKSSLSWLGKSGLDRATISNVVFFDVVNLTFCFFPGPKRDGCSLLNSTEELQFRNFCVFVLSYVIPQFLTGDRFTRFATISPKERTEKRALIRLENQEGCNN